MLVCAGCCVGFLPAPTTAGPRAAGVLQADGAGQLSLRWFGESGKRYQVETSTDLVQWTALPDSHAGKGEVISVAVTDASGQVPARLFWRTVAEPNTPPAAGMSPDRPVFATEHNGVYGHPWGPAGDYWPRQLFWENVEEYQRIRQAALESSAAIENDGRAPLLGQVAWGIDLLLANGGDPAAGLADFSQVDGFKQYAAWMNPRKDSYFSLDVDGHYSSEGQGYISFGMPLLPGDITNGKSAQTFGEWAGERIGRLALDIGCRGVYGADFFIGINFNADSHPRLVDSFATWAGVAVPPGSVRERANYIGAHHRPAWLDFIGTMQAEYYATIGKTLLAGGKTPMVGGQIHYDPPLARWGGNDPRLWAQRLPGRYWSFFVETQSGNGRELAPYWLAVYSIAATACREPDVPIGIMLDADTSYFWDTAAAAGWPTERAWLHLKQLWLSSGWAHVANRDGSVRRATQSFFRSYGDSGAADPEHMIAILGHVPRHPFGPAFYYSVNVERSFEAAPPPGTDTPNYYYYWIHLSQAIRTATPGFPKPGVESVIQGINLGYWVSDAVDPATLPAANRPSAWLTYNSDRLPAAERARLEAVAPVVDLLNEPARALAAGPVRATGSGLNLLAFIDQNDHVILMVSNEGPAAAHGTLEFTQVGNGLFECHGLLDTPDATLTIAGNQGSLPIAVAARDTLVFEIPNLKWLGH